MNKEITEVKLACGLVLRDGDIISCSLEGQQISEAEVVFPPDNTKLNILG